MKTNSRFIRSFLVFGIAVLTCLPLVAFAQAPADKESAKTDDKNAAAKSAGNAPAADSAQADSRDQRLQKIEEQLRALLDEVEKLRKARGGEPATQPSPAVTLDSKWTQALNWRLIGPAGMGGRIVDFTIVDSDPNTYWVATASGGLLKTTNNGTTFVHQFDREATVSIGCVCVAPSDPNVVWVGTGENNPRNSVSYGDGVYKSTDGGKTWKNMGLGKSFQVGRIAIHRTNPDIVYVGTLGRLYGSNEERGFYKTTDGGKTWERVLYVDDKTGVIDMRMHPTDSDTLLVAMWERERDGYDSHPGGGMEDGFDSYDPIKKWGAGAGIYKTTDGGKNWHKLAKGLPTNKMGRIGLDYYRKDPNTVFAIIDCEKIGMGTPPKTGQNIYVDVFGEDAEGGLRLVRVREGGPSAKAGLQVGDVVQSIDDRVIAASEQLFDAIRAHKVGDKIKYKLLREGATVEITVTLERRPDVTGNEGNVYLGIMGEDAEKGARVTRIVEGAPADKAGLKVGDVIESIGGRPVENYNQLLDETRTRKPGDKVKFRIRRDDKSQDVEVTLAERPAGRGPRAGGGGGRPGRPVKNSPVGLHVRRANGKRAGRARAEQLSNTAASINRPTAARAGSGSTASIRGPCISARSASIPAMTSISTSAACRSIDRATAARHSSPTPGNVHADQHAMWIDPRDGRHMLVGCDGGFYVTYDRQRIGTISIRWRSGSSTMWPSMPEAALLRRRRFAGQRLVVRADGEPRRHRPDQ